MALFGKPKYTIVRLKKREIPDGLWTKCERCPEVLYNKTLEENLKVCPKCNYHFVLGAYERIKTLLDKDTFLEYDQDMISADPLDFKGPKTYKDKLAQDQQATGLKEAAITGEALLDNKKIIIAVTDSRFIMGSMGSVVGERFVRGVQVALEQKCPFICFSASGGARMQEGLLSLMQMAKTCAALTQLSQERLPFISVLTDPTMGGVSASFAFMGDVVIAEPGALIGFAGARVIQQTVRETLPEGFQRAEFLLEHGAVDMIIDRREMKNQLATLITLLTKQAAVTEIEAA